MLFRRNDAMVDELSHPLPGSQQLHFARPFAASSWQQFQVLMWRWLVSYWRNPGYNATRIAFCVVRVRGGSKHVWAAQEAKHSTL